MQATITYLLTEQAQRAQMAATGQPVARKQVITAEIPADALDLFHVDDGGEASLNLGTGYIDKFHRYLQAAGWSGDQYQPASATTIKTAEEIVADLRRGHGILAAKQREEKSLESVNGAHNRAVTETVYQQFLADPDRRGSEYSIRDLIPGLRRPADWWPESHAGLCAEIRRRNQADRAAKEAEEKAKDQAKSDFIAAWVQEHASEDDRQQFADGLLARKTVLSLIASAAFDRYGVPQAADKPVLCEDRGCQCHDSYVDALPRSVYPAWRALKAKLPEGFSAKFSEVRDCRRTLDGSSWDPDEPSADPPYYTAEITIPEGPFSFERTVKLQ